MLPPITAEYFSQRDWWTPMQIRDNLYYQLEDLTTDFVNTIKLFAQKEQARRKILSDIYVECPFCKGYHGQRNNIDNLCENHESQLAPLRFDSKLNNKFLDYQI